MMMVDEGKKIERNQLKVKTFEAVVAIIIEI